MFLPTSSDSVPDSTLRSDSELEYAKYVKAEHTVDDESLSPLSWWQAHWYEYPILRTIAIKYIVCQVTSAESERSFSIAKLVYSRRGGWAMRAGRFSQLVFHSLNDPTIKRVRDDRRDSRVIGRAVRYHKERTYLPTW